MKIEFHLYVKSEDKETQELARMLTEQIQKNCGKDASLKVVSIINNPSVVEKYQIFVTPTLMKVYPPPFEKIFWKGNDVKQLTKVIKKVC